jgi:hypothetical protein
MAQKLILLSLADRAGADNTAFPSYETLTNDTGANRKTICKAINELKALRLIADTGERKGPTKSVIVWQLVGVPDRHEAVPKTEQFQNRSSPKNGTDSSPENGTQNLSVEPTRSCSSYAHAREENPLMSPEETFTTHQSDTNPKTPHDWAQYFIQRCGYRLDQAITPKSMAMFRQWLADGVTPEDIEDAAMVAEAKLGAIPANPTYYRGFVAEVVLEKQRAKENPAARWNSKPGSISKNNNQRENYETNKRFGQRKLSVAERATEQVRELERLYGYGASQNFIDITDQCFRVN